MATEVFIAGGGWRVQRFILPALELAGFASENITVFRRSAAKIDDFQNVDVISDFESYARTPDIVVNCLPADLLLDFGSRLLERFPTARQFWDTPPTAAFPKLLKAKTNARLRSVTSLEDFVTLPNIVALTRSAGDEVMIHLHHFGIPAHFLSVVRTSLRGLGRRFDILRKSGDKIVSGNGFSMMQKKNLEHAALYVSGTRDRFVDHFSFYPVATPAVADEGVPLVRVIDGKKISYCVGNSDVLTYDLNARLLRDFVGLATRKSVHELDKVLALHEIFTNKLKRVDQYPFADSIKDAFGHRLLGRMGFAIVQP